MLPGEARQHLVREAGGGTRLAALAPAHAATPVARPVYRYSVVPGGVADAAELVRIVRSDKVVATHYAQFDLERAHAVTVTAVRAVYVSYRKGDRVYWTANKVLLRPGEALLSDGRNELRKRCANRISPLPRLPVEPHALDPGALDILVIEGAETGLAFRAGKRKPAPPPFPGGDTPPSAWPPPLITGKPPRPDPAPFLPVPDPARPGPPRNPPLDPPPRGDVPEPGTPWLMAAAMVALLAWRGKR